ncbi:penicillin-binding protein 1C [Pleionea sp. CnH1-48]|uniref:penicillin-binding protein 1C n=1 Tax=Pleionea sp. CnH1-48 TaxID=2954494 RepID=UPI0020978839|nr:penicillin-binding protein 1C [Pleionea sp. CnH1-48]MCO7226343.1 penicillin-binding protein 1C [Pleionea sp. CnH1-48]
MRLARWLNKKKKGLALLLAPFLLFLLLDFLFPLPLPGQHSQDFAQVITDNKGQPLRVFADADGVWRYPIKPEDVSPLYLEALLNYEDRWFEHHPGVNPLSLMRAVGQWLYYGRAVSGASTLTMQVARLLDPHSKSIPGKLKQIFRALQLEWHLEKSDILTLYLNYAPFGGPLEGVEAASFAYLGKSSSQLSHAEAALLAVLPQSPSRNRPDRYPLRAEKSRNKLLDRLATYEVWHADTITSAKQEPVLAEYNTAPLQAPLLARRLAKRYPQQRVIRSTIDSELQSVLAEQVKEYAESFPVGTSAAALIVENKTRSAVAYVGAADFGDSLRYGHVDMIQAQRSPGSTLKPFLYGIAIDEGLVHEKSLLLDTPADFNGYRPENFHQGFSGPVTLRSALQRSLNLPAVQVLEALTPEVFYARLASAGLKLNLPHSSKPNLSLVLGGAGTNLESLTTTFSSLANQGYAGPIRLSQFDPDSKGRRLLSPQSAWLISDILRGVSLVGSPIERISAQRHHRIAFKTGTSYGFRDAWVLASSQNYTLGVWVGRPDGSILMDNFGRRSAVPLLKRILNVLPASGLAPSPRPEQLSKSVICWPLGTTLTMNETPWCHQQHSSWLVDGMAPPTLVEPQQQQWAQSLTSIWVDDAGKRLTPNCLTSTRQTLKVALWPQSLDSWLPLKWKRSTLLPELATHCEEDQVLRQTLAIRGIQAQATLYSAPSDNALPKVLLHLEGAQGEAHWFINGQWLSATANKEHALEWQATKEGAFEISVIDSAGQIARLNFNVRS